MQQPQLETVGCFIEVILQCGMVDSVWSCIVTCNVDHQFLLHDEISSFYAHASVGEPYLEIFVELLSGFCGLRTLSVSSFGE